MGSLYRVKKESFFAASNTKDGFVSYFDNIFGTSDIERLYIIKGGPGVGKSTFMKRTGQKAKTEGLSCEYFYCSSDPDSLDGIIIKEKKIAVIDGTRPHSVEPKMPGVRETIIDFGRAWDTDALVSEKENLQKLSKEKSDCYESCYRFLHGKNVMDNMTYNLVFPYILFDKLDKSAARFCKSALGDQEHKSRGKTLTRITKAISSKGLIRLDTFENTADYCVFLKEPFYGCRLAGHFLRAIYEYARNSGIDVVVSYDCQNKNEIDGLFFPNAKTSVTLYDEALVARCDREMKRCKIINCKRFINEKAFSDLKPLRKFYCRLSENMLSLALESLEKAGRAHMETEKIYRLYTDYRTVEKIGDEYCKRIFQ